MSENDRSLLSIGVFLVACIIAIFFHAYGFYPWTHIFPVVMVIFGFYLVALGAANAGKPLKYARSPFSTMMLGLCGVGLGVAWFIFSFGWLYSLMVILLVAAFIAIASSLHRK